MAERLQASTAARRRCRSTGPIARRLRESPRAPDAAGSCITCHAVAALLQARERVLNSNCTPAPARGATSRVTHVARAIGRRKELSGVGFERERDAEIAFRRTRAAAASGQERRSAASGVRRIGDEAFRRRSDGRTLQRPPPLIRIFRPPSAVLSMSTDGRRSARRRSPPRGRRAGAHGQRPRSVPD